MERFTPWRDEFTGVHPFLPVKGQVRGAPWALKMVFGTVLALLKLPLLLVVSAWLILMNFLCNLIPISLLRRGLTIYTTALGARVALLLLGFLWIPATVASIRGKQAKQRAGSGVQSGDLMVCNHVSYVELLYLAFRFSPQFVALPNDRQSSDSTTRVLPLGGVLPALLHTLAQAPVPSDHPDLCPLSDLLVAAREGRRGPVVLFPEGTTSTGKGLLHCNTGVLAALPAASLRAGGVHVIGFRLDARDFWPAYIGQQQPLSHIFFMCAQFYNYLEVRYLPSDEVPAMPAEGGDYVEWGNTVCNYLASMLRLKKMTKNAQDKQTFLRFWRTGVKETVRSVEKVNKYD